jgi:hypothetical protein
VACQLLGDLAFPAAGGVLAGVDGGAEVLGRDEGRGPVRDALRERRDFLDGTSDHDRDGANRGVQRVCGADRAVGHEIDLVQLDIHSVDRSAGLREQRDDGALEALQQAGQPPGRARQA